MKIKFVVVTLYALAIADVHADALCTSDAFGFAVDTIDEACVVTSAVDVVSFYCRAGQCVTATETYSHAVETLVESATATGKYDWKPSAGGVWTLVNPKEGEATVAVRYSIFAPQQGTVSDPARFVDCAELSEFISSGNMADGYTFQLLMDSLADSLQTSSGWRLECLGEKLYRFAVSSDGSVYRSCPVAFTTDSKKAGPDRTVYKNGENYISYTGDNWVRLRNDDSTLTIVSPSGATTHVTGHGTGLVPFDPTETGLWQVTLEAGGKSFTADIRVLAPHFAISIL